MSLKRLGTLIFHSIYEKQMNVLPLCQVLLGKKNHNEGKPHQFTKRFKVFLGFKFLF